EFGGFYQTSILSPPTRMLYRIEVLSQLQSAAEHVDALRMSLSTPESSWDGAKSYQDDLMNDLSSGASRGRLQEMSWTDRRIKDVIFAADIGYEPGPLSRFFSDWQPPVIVRHG